MAERLVLMQRRKRGRALRGGCLAKKSWNVVLGTIAAGHWGASQGRTASAERTHNPDQVDAAVLAVVGRVLTRPDPRPLHLGDWR